MDKTSYTFAIGNSTFWKTWIPPSSNIDALPESSSEHDSNHSPITEPTVSQNRNKPSFFECPDRPAVPSIDSTQEHHCGNNPGDDDPTRVRRSTQLPCQLLELDAPRAVAKSFLQSLVRPRGGFKSNSAIFRLAAASKFITSCPMKTHSPFFPERFSLVRRGLTGLRGHVLTYNFLIHRPRQPL